MAYNIDVPKTNVPEALEILVDSVVNPKFLSWEVKDAVEKMETDLKAVKDNPQTLLMEVRLFLQATRIRWLCSALSSMALRIWRRALLLSCVLIPGVLDDRMSAAPCHDLSGAAAAAMSCQELLTGRVRTCNASEVCPECAVWHACS